ncbi:phosphatase PAP2 family protein [Actinospica durhamensis]|uniref:Phosphatase PAP2 family protein n=1 Tax=Actinospica durhamensis TaxID=1508375 RepID=A0A941IQ43_9ACTN|nr:phosphatase PAP2 family protein [Actinospica durhamensis]MBR7833802.1 phosphatase PAP2 family protein [Actinospica durhamensis]
MTSSSSTAFSRRGFLAASAALPVALYAAPSASAATGSPLGSSAASASERSLADTVTGLPFVESYQTNLSANLTAATNAAVRALDGMATAWQTGTAWNNGTVLLPDYLRANMRLSARITAARTEAQAKEAFVFDRQDQSYAMITGLGPLAELYKSGALAVTSITSAPDGTPATTISDAVPVGAPAGSATGPGSPSSQLGLVVQLEQTLRGNYASGNPSKAAYNYPRPWRMNEESEVVDTGAVDAYGFPVYETDVTVCPQLLLQRSATPASDGGFPSGHTNAFTLAGIAYAYAVPERFQELIARASYCAHTRIVAGMHSPNDVIGGRVLGTALAAATLYDPANAELKAAARAQALAYFEAQTGTDADTLFAYAHSQGTDQDPYADREANAALVAAHLTYGLPTQGSDKPATPYQVPLGAEVLLETRQPYLTAQQRRDVLASTAIEARNVMLDGFEQWGRINLFAAADGYGAFAQDVTVTMDSSQGGFGAADAWRNDIGGRGGLTKQGSGTLTLTGANSYAGGTLIAGGTLVAAGAQALGTGDVEVSGATLGVSLAAKGCQGGLTVHGRLTLDSGAALALTLDPESPPRIGSTAQVITARQVRGWFSAVTTNVAGIGAVPVQTAQGVAVRFVKG